jgi:hypothetical protein
MAELIDVVNAIFTRKSEWSKITDDDKEKNFFIINRYMSKKYPVQAQLLNQKSINKISAINLWYFFILNDRYYTKWFWSKSVKDKEELIITEKDFNYLVDRLKINEFNLKSLIEYYPDMVIDELKYYKDIDKNSKK